MKTPEELFLEENGIPVEEAVEMILSWQKAGEQERAQKGATEILKIFPEHPQMRALLAELPEETKKTGIEKAIAQVNAKTKDFQEKTVSKSQERLPEMDFPKEDERIVAVLAYAWFLVLLPLLLKRESKFVQFHAWQGLMITLIFLLINSVFFNFFLLFVSAGIFTALVKLSIFAIYLTGGIMAYQGKWFRFPLIWPFAEKLQKLF